LVKGRRETVVMEKRDGVGVREWGDGGYGRERTDGCGRRKEETGDVEEIGDGGV